MTDQTITRSKVNPNHLAEALKYILFDLDKTVKAQFEKDSSSSKNVSYSSLRTVDWTNTVQSKRMKKAFSDAFSKLNFPFLSASITGEGSLVTYVLDNAKTENIDKLEPGRIIVLADGSVKSYYLVTSYSQGDFSTFPTIVSQVDKAKLENILAGSAIKANSITALVPQFKEIPFQVAEEIRKIAHELYPQLDAAQEGNNEQTFNFTDYGEFGPNFLQIGDVVTTVDPTQISFSTSNGYHYFPTLRTHGNPKVPTMQQVKNINVSLIFPNQDAINYQLLNIFAMFRRTPFVTIRNVDIVEFFKDIILEDSYIPVALESISIQSIDGFPNTLQAQLTFLPFDPRVTGEGLLAVKSMADVLSQQAFLYRDRRLHSLIEKSSRLLEEESVLASRFDDIISPSINKTANFRESLPFRSFYQSLIAERDYVTNDFGGIVETDLKNYADLTPFRPTKDENYLHHYRAEDNQIPIGLRYRYIDGDFTDTTSLLSKARQEQDVQRISELRDLMDIITTPEELLRTTMTAFYDTTDFYRKYSYKHSEMNNIVKTYLARHGITVQGTPADDITNLTDFLGKTLNPFSEISHISNAYDQAKDYVNGNVSKQDAPDVLGEFSNVIWNQSLNDKLNTGSGTTTVKTAVDNIFNWMNVGDANDKKSRKGKFVAFLTELGNRMRNDINSDYGVLFNPGQNDFLITRLPLKDNWTNPDEQIIIDNRNDVVTGWTVQFANKFTPMNISAFKYPFYQHMGSDDISISLAITSASKGDDLKSKLSTLSDRLYDTAKLTQLTAPELSTYIDSRLTLTSVNGNLLPDGHIFRVFGVQHVIYNSSNTTNTQNSPGAWNTVLNLTQANFTIQDYHAIESYESSVPMRDEIANLLTRMDPDGKDKFTVFKYKIYDVSKFQENIRGIIESSDEADIKTVKNYIEKNRASLEYTEVTDLETLTRLSYLFSPYAESVTEHINLIQIGATKLSKEAREARLKEIPNRIAWFEKAIGGEKDVLSRHPNSTGIPVRIAEYTQKIEELKKEKKILGTAVDREEKINEQIAGRKASDKHIKQLKNIFNGSIVREIDKTATMRLSQISKDFPNFKKILNFNLNVIQQLYSDQTNALKNLIDVNEPAWKVFKDTLIDDALVPVAGVVGAVSATAIGAGVGTTIGIGGAYALSSLVGLTLSAVTFALPVILVATAVGGLILLGRALLANAREAAIDTLRDQFSEFFAVIIQNIRESTITDLASQIFKDPVVLNKFIASGVLSKATTSLLKYGLYKTITNCYGDFDFRPFTSANQVSDDIDPHQLIRLTPDFYLYNFRLSDSEVLAFHDDAFERYINIGKLSSMTGLIETANAMDRLKEIEEGLGGTGKTNQLLNNVKELVYNKSDYENSRNELLEWYKASVFLDLNDNWENEAAKNSFFTAPTETRIKELMEEFEKFNPFPDSDFDLPGIELGGTPQQRQWHEKKRAYEALLKSKTNNIVVDRDKFIVNIIYAARARALIELYLMHISINDYLTKGVAATESTEPKDSKQQKLKEEQKKIGTFFRQSSTTLIELNNDIQAILETASQDHMIDTSSTGLLSKRLKNNIGPAGGANAQRKVDLPDVINLKNSFYEKIATYIRLNHAVSLLNEETSVKDVLNDLPSLRFLQYWNFREREATVHRIESLSDFMDSYTTKIDSTLRMFPTFKLYFIEEDKGIFNQLDDFYVYNAIQSVEITSNKNLASTVARIRLSNVTGTLTNRMNFQREKSDYPTISSPEKSDNIFFGTLDVKPGTSIMIKLGYAANDQDLPTTFIGRIIEMNVGAQVEIIAQSYSAQLNHEILHEKFGMWGTVKGHGDVASATLDMVPGLEKMGKVESFSVAKGFSGKSIRKSKGTFGDRFLLSNLLGSVSALQFAQDNPRDDNIYLPYDLVDDPLNKPQFDWVIYDQSVWEVLQELCLYNRNTRPIVKLYNDDSLSIKSDSRQTLVVGDKSGYYKFTDSYSLSSRDYTFIENKVQEFQKLLVDLENADVKKVIDAAIKVSYTSTGDSLGRVPTTTIPERNARITELFTNSFYSDFYKFLCDSNTVLIVALHLIKNTTHDATTTGWQDLFLALGSNIPGFAKEQGISSDLFEFSNTCSAIDIQTGDYVNRRNKTKLFRDVLVKLKDRKLPTTLNPEDFYIINPQINNKDESLAYKPNYKKIQKHHLISDDTDILSNNIVLSSNFKNSVNLYYPDKAKIADLNGLTVRERKNLNVFTIKAIGDTRDEHVRPLNSFQKNIDTSWYEVNRQVEGFFKGFQKMQATDKNDNTNVRNWVGDETDPNSINLDIVPAFWTVGVSLLQHEVEKMYQGTIEIVGDATIQPFDILHINDNLNDMHGTVEVEEVTHSFTPDGGFRTVITPNLITYDRNPIQMQDVSVINNIYEFAKTTRAVSHATVGALGAAFTGAAVLNAVGNNWWSAVGLAATGLPMLWNGTVGTTKKYHRFLYDNFGKIMGRDCVNFSALIFHNMPYIAGFDGLDYTTLTTLMNYGVKEISSPIARLAAFTDPWAATITTDWKPETFGVTGLLQNWVAQSTLPGIPLVSRGLPTGAGNYNLGVFDFNL